MKHAAVPTQGVNFDGTIVLQPDLAEQCRNRADTLLSEGRFEEAIESYDKAIALKADDAPAYNNRGTALKNLKRFAEALDSYERAIVNLPDRAELHSNRAMVLYELGRLEEAVNSYDAAVRLKPDYVEALWNKSLLHLLLGQFEEGWRGYETRKRNKDSAVNRHFNKPEWLGDTDIAGKTILVHWEQGYGDVILFSRYVILCQNAGARVLFAPQKPLKSLMRGLHASVQVVDPESDVLVFDCHCPLMSLAFAFKTDLTTVPRGTYLSADQGTVAAWAHRLGKKTRPRIGVVWSRTGPLDPSRSIALESFQQLFDDRFEFVSLQKHLTDAEQSHLDGAGIFHPGEALFDFSDTAALCQLMDLVVSIDTSVVHLAGALGTPVWVLLPQVSSWIWMLDRDDSPWYPTARLFRQRVRGDWNEVLRRVRGELLSQFEDRLQANVPRQGGRVEP
jgi:tetratricopeptide (TPR) repeat protein